MRGASLRELQWCSVTTQPRMMESGLQTLPFIGVAADATNY